jgi:8-oxo-dGTP pyrophosphatase MutT (NUDIX family)
LVYPTVPKAFIYLTRSCHELLLLAHPLHPEAGLQVPAGTILPREKPYDAARRELVEETGLGREPIKDLSFAAS